MTFRYEDSTQWLKGNTHIHTTASDGGMTPDELSEIYGSARYDFLFRTDHWVASDVSTEDQRPGPVWFDGVELDGHDEQDSYFHIICLGRVEGISREMGFPAALHAAREQGAILIIAHPHWCGNSLEDCSRWPAHGIEVYNHVCHWLNGKSNGQTHWDHLLRSMPSALAIAADDTHLSPGHPGWNGGWIMVQGEDCTEATVRDAILKGRFYSSCGPEFYRLTATGREVTIETSTVSFIRLVGPAFNGQRIGNFDGELLTEATFTIPEDWSYAYLEIEDSDGHRAWTNNLFV